MAELPTGTLTFLFTDIEGSTRLLQRLGERFPQVVADHHRLLRESFGAEGGIEVMGEGDAFFVVFQSAPAAAAAAVAAQRALARHGWPDDSQVTVRMGLHTGEGLLVGDNYGGLDVHRAARIADAAHGGQILVSEATKALIAPSRPDGTSLHDLGDYRLKDIELPEHLFQLSVDGLRKRFPPPRSLDARPTNLPTAPTSFVSRDAEVTEIKGLIEKNRLVTLTGPGGTGKTRLSLQVAHDLLPAFRDGVFFVGLAAVTDPMLVPSTIAHALDLREEKERPIDETLEEHLASKEMLLVLDNFEQILSAATFVSALLEGARRVKGLVTSRAALSIYGEQEYPVPPMTVPKRDQLASVRNLSDFEAIGLFTQRGKAVRPDFTLTEDNAAAVVEICERVDGLPLAIELVAARLKLLAPRDILERLDKGLFGATVGARDLPERQRTLRGTIDWSYRLLDEDIQVLFRRLGVFVGGWSFAAAEEICNPDGELGGDTLEALGVVLDNNLIRRYDDERGATRFRMLQTIREFALAVLDEQGEKDDLQRRHAGFFLELAEKTEPLLVTDAESAGRLAEDHDNLRAALQWCIDHDESQMGLAMAAALWRFWHLRGHLAEGRRWVSKLLDLPAARHPTRPRAKALMSIGSLAYWQNDFEATRVYYEEGLDIFRQLDDAAGIAQALYNLGFIGLLESDYAMAGARYSESRSIYERLDDAHGVAHTSWGLSMTALLSGDLDEARRLGDETLRRYQEVGDWFGQTNCAFIRYEVARRSGNFAEALDELRSALDETSMEQDPSATASILETLGDVVISLGSYEEGLRFAGAASSIKEALGGGAPPALIAVPDARERARGAIPEPETLAAWNEGRALSPEEAIASARKLLSNPAR